MSKYDAALSAALRLCQPDAMPGTGEGGEPAREEAFKWAALIAMSRTFSDPPHSSAAADTQSDTQSDTRHSSGADVSSDAHHAGLLLPYASFMDHCVEGNAEMRVRPQAGCWWGRGQEMGEGGLGLLPPVECSFSGALLS